MIAILVLAAAAAAPLEKPEWVRVGTHVDGGAIEVNKTSVFEQGGLTRAWWRTHFAQPRQDGSVQEEQLMAVDCEGGLSTVLALVSLDPQGNIVREVREPEGAALRRLSPATPGTNGERVAEAACDLRGEMRGR